MESYNLIWSEEEIKKFFDNVLPELLPTEVYFVSLSARNKYLTEEERVSLELGRTEMFERKIIRKRDWNKFIRTVKKFNSMKGSYTTKNNSFIPEKCIVVYININPSDVLKVYSDYNKIMMEYFFELQNCAVNHVDLTGVLEKISKMNEVMMTCYQRNTGVKHLLDVDFDVPKNEGKKYLLMFLRDLTQNKVKFNVLETKSGYHVILHRSTLKYNFHGSIDKIVKIIEDEESWDNWEVVKNVNQMVPLPGTYQGGFSVIDITEKIKELL